MPKVKIIIAGGKGRSNVYALSFKKAFDQMNDVEAKFFDTDYIDNARNKIQHLFFRFSSKYSVGPIIQKLNSGLIEECQRFKPDILFVYNSRFFKKSTIRKIKAMGITVFGYSNDNPFSTYYPRYFWRHFRENIPQFDITYVYRKSNIEDAKKYGAKETKLLKSYYIKERNYICEKSEKITGVPDVIFLGHYEADNREEYISALLNEGISVGLPDNDGWRRCFENHQNVVFLKDTLGKYNEMICSTKIPITFLSTLNNDTYTRRCFEIPAAGAFLICPYTEDMASMFENGKEAILFKDKEEFVDKIKYYLIHAEERDEIAKAGRRRLLKDGHEVADRARQIINDFDDIKRTS